MNAEYQRLEAEASEVQNQIHELVKSCGQMVAADFQKFGAEMTRLHQKLAGLREGMGLLKLAGSATMQAQAAKLAKSQNAAGRRIVVTTDGGRVRLREKRRGRTKKGHKRFKPAWREPRLFMIYATDEHGKLDPAFSPIIDGSLGSCDQLFRLLLSYLKALHVKDASKVLFIADGAAWIWKRVPSLITSLGLTTEQTQQRIDYWHAVEYLGKIVESSSLLGKPKTQWLKTQKNRLYRSDIGLVVIAIRELVGTQPSKDQTTWLNYFENHGLAHRRMDYSVTVSNHLPIGSGAIESAVRRVINLRVKSNATYWLRENAETIIRFRAWIKAGRAEELFHQTTYVTPELAI